MGLYLSKIFLFVFKNTNLRLLFCHVFIVDEMIPASSTGGNAMSTAVIMFMTLMYFENIAKSGSTAPIRYLRDVSLTNGPLKTPYLVGLVPFP